MSARLREPMRFTRGGRTYIITATYAANDDGYLGLCDGRVVARAADRAEVARALISSTPLTYPNLRTGSG